MSTTTPLMATVKKVLVVVGAMMAAFSVALPDGTPGSPRTIVIGIGLAAVAGAAAI